MSKEGGAWAGGGSRPWRRVRLSVLRRDDWICQLCKEPIDRQARPPDPGCASVHHTRGKRYGDDPKYLVAAHLGCNLKVGDPERHDPSPQPRTDWTLTLVAAAQDYLGSAPTPPDRCLSSLSPAPAGSVALPQVRRLLWPA